MEKENLKKIRHAMMYMPFRLAPSLLSKFLKFRRIFTSILLVTFSLVLSQIPKLANALPSATEETAWDVCFSPKGGCADLIIKDLGEAKRIVRVQAYSFTSKPIAQALIDAHKRGVTVEVILDESQRTENDTQAAFLIQAGIPVLIDAAHSIAHNKVMVVDGEIVITRSFNFTRAAEEDNAENLLVVHDKILAAKYETNWQNHKMHSETFSAMTTPAKMINPPKE